MSDFPTATVSGKGNNLHVSHGSDDGLFVRFYFNKIYDKNFVKINIPGDSKTEWDRPVLESDKMRFQKQWDAFINQQSQFGSQMMLKDWECISEAQVSFYNARNVQTVEQLAVMTDSMITSCGMGTRELVRKAQGYMEEMKSRKQIENVNHELQRRDTEIAMLKEQMDALSKKMVDGMGAARKAKGWPKGKPRKKVTEATNDPATVDSGGS